MKTDVISTPSSPNFCPFPRSKASSSTTFLPLVETLQQWRQKAKAAIAEGDYRQAIAYLTQVIQRAPHSALDYNNRGLMYFYQGQLRNALHDYEQAILLNPTLDSPYNNRANCLVALKRPQDALWDYEMAIDLNPSNIKTWLNFGITLREEGQLDLAIEKFDIALIIGSVLQGRLFAERGYTYYLRGDWNCAIADYRRAMAHLTPGDGYCLKVSRLLHKLTNPVVDGDS